MTYYTTGLLIDTTGYNTSVAVVGKENRLNHKISSFNEDSGLFNDHSANIPTQIQEVLKLAEVTVDDLEFLGVVSGPGSFTGVRIGFAYAKGLAAGLNIPLFSSTMHDCILENRAYQNALADKVIVLSSGRRGILYKSEYSVSESSFKKTLFSTVSEDVLVSELKSMDSALQSGIEYLFFENTSESLIGKVNDTGLKKFETVLSHEVISGLAITSVAKFEQNKQFSFSDVANCNPVYGEELTLKSLEDRKLKWRKGKNFSEFL